MTVTISNLSAVSSPFLRRIVSLGTAFRQPVSAGGLFPSPHGLLPIEGEMPVRAEGVCLCTPISVAMKSRNWPIRMSTVSSMMPTGGIQRAVMLTMAATTANQIVMISFALRCFIFFTFSG